MKTHQRFLLLGSMGLLLTAIILILSSRSPKPPDQAEHITGAATSVWQAFPTRHPLVTATLPANRYHELVHNTILYHDYQTAEMTLSEAKNIYPDDPYIIQSEARLALVQGNYRKAEDLIWESIGKDPTSATNWALAAAIFTFNDEPALASQALATALELNPNLSPHLFQERWAIAIHNGDAQMVTLLADEYYLIHPTEPLADYYNATALLLSGHTNIAITLLVDKLSSEVRSPAVLWFTLGQAYLERHSYWESVKSLEYAKFLIDAGDTSMRIVAGDSDYLLAHSLATAYLGNRMCAQAEGLFRQLQDEDHAESYSDSISEAVECQTPTPTPTHWMLSIQGTVVTPSPN